MNESESSSISSLRAISSRGDELWPGRRDFSWTRAGRSWTPGTRPWDQRLVPGELRTFASRNSRNSPNRPGESKSRAVMLQTSTRCIEYLSATWRRINHVLVAHVQHKSCARRCNDLLFRGSEIARGSTIVVHVLEYHEIAMASISPDVIKSDDKIGKTKVKRAFVCLVLL